MAAVTKNKTQGSKYISLFKGKHDILSWMATMKISSGRPFSKWLPFFAEIVKHVWTYKIFGLITLNQETWYPEFNVDIANKFWAAF